MKLFSLFLICCVFCCETQSFNILFVGPVAAYSHFTIVFRLAKELADRNHQVTVINPYPQKQPIKNYRDISVEEIVDYLQELKASLFSINWNNIIASTAFVADIGLGVTEATLKNKNVQALLNSDETFDAVIVEHFYNEALIGFAHRFKAPLILLNSVASSSNNNYIFANPAPSSYVPNLSGSLTKHMNFWERLENFAIIQFSVLFNELYSLPKQKALFEKYFNSDIDFYNVLYNTSLLLANSHVSINDAVPHVPSIIEIGGYHVSPPKPLPESLKRFLDDAKEGVILFSMGSNLKSKDLKPEVQKSILSAFSKIKQKVLWKFEAELPGLPKNVKIMEWVPQQDVLAHPNVKAFISHGGLLSTIEAVYFGVPIIGIPVFADQKSNIASAVLNGYAVSLPLDQLTEEKMSFALNEILNNLKYTQNVKWRSQLIHDQPLKPIDSAVYWIDHVIRNKGAPHLRSAGLDLRWYEREMIDIFAFLALLVLSVVIIVFISVRKICRMFCKNSKTQKGKKVKKN